MDINEFINSMFEDEDMPEDFRGLPGSLQGKRVDGGMIAEVAAFADMAVQAAIAEIAAMAAELGTDQVPVTVLRMYAEQQSVASQMLWAVTNASGADLDMGVTVPDDLSELDGL